VRESSKATYYYFNHICKDTNTPSWLALQPLVHYYYYYYYYCYYYFYYYYYYYYYYYLSLTFVGDVPGCGGGVLVGYEDIAPVCSCGSTR